MHGGIILLVIISSFPTQHPDISTHKTVETSKSTPIMSDLERELNPSSNDSNNLKLSWIAEVAFLKLKLDFLSTEGEVGSILPTGVGRF
jgi:hypothetical protein